MSSITPIDSSQNIYAIDVNFTLMDKKEVYVNNRLVHKLTYRNDEYCLLFKISQVVFTALATLATLGILMSFAAGRNLWKTAIKYFKQPVVYQNIATITQPTFT